MEKEKNGGWVLQSVSWLGDAIGINVDVFQKTEKLFYYLYGIPDETQINETRSRKFCMENKPEPHQLPPIKDDLTQCISANQAYEWNRALETNLDIPSPIGHGWEKILSALSCDRKSSSLRMIARTSYVHLP